MEIIHCRFVFGLWLALAAFEKEIYCSILTYLLIYDFETILFYVNIYMTYSFNNFVDNDITIKVYLNQKVTLLVQESY